MGERVVAGAQVNDQQAGEFCAPKKCKLAARLDKTKFRLRGCDCEQKAKGPFH